MNKLSDIVHKNISVPIGYVQIYGVEEAVYLKTLESICEFDANGYGEIDYPKIMLVLNMNYTRQARLIKSLEFRNIIETTMRRNDGRNKKLFKINKSQIKKDMAERAEIYKNIKWNEARDEEL